MAQVTLAARRRVVKWAKNEILGDPSVDLEDRISHIEPFILTRSCSRDMSHLLGEVVELLLAPALIFSSIT
ncbi:hypothetical protein NW762_009477 [Fusarium torreyae]|uniref:Uncharacterized protein n=1 Tax=Fusarium torreyae TaxID=1237075 RepID=A0A9W8VCC9_9HYPO|nr:hypothetical protein NW762_009477 [Fusarium torreyae]